MSAFELDAMRSRNRLDAGIPFLAVVRNDELHLIAPAPVPSAADREHVECESLDVEHWNAREGLDVA